MLAEQYAHATGVTGARGQGDVVTPSVNDNQLNRARLAHVAAHPGTYTVSQFRDMLVPVFTSVSGKIATSGTITNWVTALFKSDAAWLQAEFGITRTINGTKTDTITVPAPVKAKAKAKTVNDIPVIPVADAEELTQQLLAAKERKGKRKVQQATLPGLE